MCACAVDVVIPVRNGRRWLGEAIDSALAQDPPPARVIVVDDGSTDGSGEVAASRGERVLVLRHETSRGLPAARNTGIRAGDSPLVGFLDADDKWLPGMTAAQVEEFERHPEIGLCWTRVVDCDEELRPVYERPFRRREAEHCFEELYRDAFPIPPSATFVRRTALEDVGLFDERFLKAQDHELWLRLSLLYPFSCIDRPLCLRRIHSDSITQRSGLDAVLRFDEMICHSIESFAARRGRSLPFPAERRIIVSRRRRLREMLDASSLHGALLFRGDLRRRGAWSARDEAAFWPHFGLATLRLLVHVLRKGTS